MTKLNIYLKFIRIYYFILCSSIITGIICGDELIEDRLKTDPDINEFYAYFNNCLVCTSTVQIEDATIFAPINAAFQKHSKTFNDKSALASYHIANVAKRIEELGDSYTSINSRLNGSPLWITISSDKNEDNYYVNNAKVLKDQSDDMFSTNNKKQYLHKIDAVLIPTKSDPAFAATIQNPNAWDFIQNFEAFIEEPHKLRIFRDKIKKHKKSDIFKVEGGHTFLIPVDDGFIKDRPNLLDDRIIDAHVIPTKVLFTTPTRKDVPFDTAANRDNNLRVFVSFTQEDRSGILINYVKSRMLSSETGKYHEGVVLAEIVKANIPVKNGVVHLIHKPLMIVDNSIKELMEEHMDYICNVGNVQRMENIWDETPSYSRFYPMHSHQAYNSRFLTFDDKNQNIQGCLDIINEVNNLGNEGAELRRKLEKSTDLTLFAPCNATMNDVYQEIKRDKEKFLKILQMHIVDGKRLSVDKAEKSINNKIYQTDTLNPRQKLYFNVVKIGNNSTMTVESGGVNATVIHPDLAAKNGIVHIIDRILGLPYLTVLEKLSTDPQLRDTYKMGIPNLFNNRLNETIHQQKFTYFVPRNEAWEDAKLEMPSEIKKLFMQEFSEHAKATLERHLIIDKQVYTIQTIKLMTSKVANSSNRIQNPEPVQLPTLRGSLQILVEEKSDNSDLKINTAYVIHWNKKKIPVYRSNVECTNGIIHVIDHPFLQLGDISVSASIFFKPFNSLVILTSLLALVWKKMFLLF